MSRANAAEPRWNEKYSRWEYRKQIDGKRRMFTSTKKGRAGANEVKRKFNRALSADSFNSNPNLKSLMPEYLKDVEARKGKNSESYRSANSMLRNHLIPALGSKRISSISEQDLQDIINNLKRVDGRKGELSRKTVMNIKSEIQLLFKYFKKSGYIEWRPDTLEIPNKFEYKKGKKILEISEVRYILKDKTEDVYLFAWQMMLLYGFRPGEVYALKWDDVGESKLTIKRSLNDKNRITQGKNENALRTEYLTNQAKEILSRARLLQVKNGQISEWVFSNSKNNPIDGHTSNTKLQRYCKENHLSIITPYRLRHTFVSLMKNVLTEAQLKLTVGHTDSMDTLGVYGHELEQDHIDTGQVLQSYFNQLLS